MTKSSVYKVFRSVALDAENLRAQREKQLTFPIQGAALCLAMVGDNQVVLVRRETPPNMGWSLPGGRVGMEETFEEASLRELAEETGIEAEQIDHLLVDEHTHFHATNGEEISIDVKTFVIQLPAGTIPKQLEDNLPVEIFELSRLPEGLLNLDRAKIESFAERARG